MTDATVTTRYETTTELEPEAPTLIEGLPGLGLVAAIAVDRITSQLDLAQHGRIVSGEFPNVAAYQDGRVRDAVRVYAGADPDVMTLQSDVPVPPSAFDALGQCVLNDLAGEFERAVFLAGAPAENDEQRGDVVGVATTDGLERALVDADIPLAQESGGIGGVTGSLLADCYHDDVPAAILLVRAHPYIPDPGAARAVIEDALEPLVEFDIETDTLLEQAEEIQEQKQQIAEQLQQHHQAEQQDQAGVRGMYQ